MTTWCCPRAKDLSLRIWSEGGVVFDDANAQLHELTPIAGEVLNQLLTGGSLTAHEILFNVLGEAPSAEEAVQMKQLLLHFKAMDIIECICLDSPATITTQQN
ncbi:hypothetical protein RF819_11405 [Rhodoferax fermentans]|uniref:HPr-rel-A system PqqD family protein n=2 Tax=Rhodoferax fermentans TaxID=28066 RepID=A0A1T1ATE2_RHOFE|nr:hypothetical protein RF819_11405 [Rhodoferax fermentans]